MTNHIRYIIYKLKSLNVTLWKYNESTPTEKLLRRHRVARYLVYTWVFASMGMMSSIAEIVILGGNKYIIIFAIACCIISLLLAIPANFFIPILSEIEKALKARGHPLPTKYPLDDIIPFWAMRMLFWGTAIVIVPWLLKDNLTTQIKILLVFLAVIFIFYLLMKAISWKKQSKHSQVK